MTHPDENHEQHESVTQTLARYERQIAALGRELVIEVSTRKALKAQLDVMESAYRLGFTYGYYKATLDPDRENPND